MINVGARLKLIAIWLIVAPIIFATCGFMAASKAPKTPNQMLQDSSRAFYQNDFNTALTNLETYFSSLGKQARTKAQASFRFYAIAAMGRIYLQYKQDPEGAIRWFEKVAKSQLLTAAEQDIVDGWIAGARDWIKLGKFPQDTKDPTTLFELGKKFYESGLKRQKYTMDLAGDADFSIASGYLVPFIIHNDKDPRTGEALFMMGDIRHRLWVDNEYWSENYYLAETIRRFPGTPLAMKAYTALAEDVHFGYSGSSGDHTPASWITMLAVFKQMAQNSPVNQPGHVNSPEVFVEPK